MKTIAFVGGGTAGHVMPNLAIISALRGEYACVYIGGDGMEKQLCAARSIPFYSIKTVKLRRDAMVRNIAVPFKLAACVKTAKRALEAAKPDLIFSKGGFAALPVVLAAKHTPILCHESDFSPGIVTKLSKRKSAHVLCAFESCAELFKNGLHCGTPLDPRLYGGEHAPGAYGLDGNKPILAVVGGSSGAATLNDITVAALPELLKCFDVIHVTGKNKPGGAPQPGYKSLEFETNMPRLYATCDMIVTRAGANALAECIALKVPTLAVPLEKASRGDQLQNAEYYRERGAIEVVRERVLTPTILARRAIELFNTRGKLISAMSALDVDGTQTICSIIRDTLTSKKPE